MTPIWNMRLDTETKARWEAAADEHGYSLAEFVRACVEAEVAGPEAVRVEVAVPAPTVKAPKSKAQRVTLSGDKRTYASDFKPGKK